MTITFGTTGAAVATLQRRLNATGVSPVVATDGVFGVGTRAAVAQAQKLAALPITGEADDVTLASLQADPLPPTGDAFIQARSYAKGRGGTPVRLLVLHSAETDCHGGVARMVAHWFASAASPLASAHYIVDPGDVVGCVHEEDTAWHAPPANIYSVGIEHAGRAAFTEAQWATDDATSMLARSTTLAAAICARHGIPPVVVDVDGLVGGAAGITRHVDVSHAFHKTDHTDPGSAWPMDDYVAAVATKMGAT